MKTVLSGRVWVLGTVCFLHVWVDVCGCKGTSDLRSTFNAQGAHSVQSHVTHIHTLSSDLHTAALEVLLVVHTHLDGWER